eukprot:7483858-Prorocentrum_lima.AAC.1
MTSSLVGSEMCIRDRREGEVKPCCNMPMPGIDQEQNRQRLGWESKGANPVSYTHLTLPTICSV